MTLIDITNQLFGLLCTSDILTAKELATITVPPEYADKREHLIRAGLKQLVDEELIREVVLPGDQESEWILVRPLNYAGQNVHLSVEVSVAISDVINTYLDAHEVEGDRCDASSLTENDVVALIQIIGELLNTELEVGDGDN